MATKSRASQFKKGVRNFDDILYLFTGKRLKHVVGRGINLFGEELAKKASNWFSGPEEPELAPDNPYFILGIHPEAMDVVVRAAYRSLVRVYHPDAGATADVEKCKKVNQAYDAIMAERKAQKGE